MFQLVGSLKTAIEGQPKTSSSTSAISESIISRLHYPLSCFILIVFSLLLTANTYFGEPIYCAKSSNFQLIDQKLLNAYCLVHSTYTEVPSTNVVTTRVFHHYYQWIWIALFAQAAFFYLPHLFWMQIEGGLVENLVSGLEKPLVEPEVRAAKLKQLTEFFEQTRALKRNAYGKLFFGHFISELLNLLNVSGQILFLDRFLNGKFFTYGWKVITSLFKVSDHNPMMAVFPSLAKCQVDRLQGGFDDQNTTLSTTVCLLSQNILAEKIYLFLWFWLYFLLIATFFSLTLSIVFLLKPLSRSTFICFHCRILSKSSVNEVILSKNSSLNEAFLLYLLARNISPLHCYNLVASLKRLQEVGDKDNKMKQQFYFSSDVEECEKIITVFEE